MLTCNSRISATLGFPIKVACWLERSRSNGSLLNPKVEVDPLTGVQGVK